MKLAIFIAVLVLVALVFIFYLGSMAYVSKMSHQSIKVVTFLFEALNVGKIKISYDEIKITGLKSIEWKKVRVTFKGVKSTMADGRYTIDAIQVTGHKLFSLHEVTVTLKGINFYPSAADPQMQDVIKNRSWIFRCSVPKNDMRRAALNKGTLKDVAEKFLQTGRIPFKVDFSGEINFLFRGKERKLRMSLEPSAGGMSVFSTKFEDLKPLTAVVGETVSDEEITVMCRFPWRAPTVLEIKNSARIKSENYSDMVSDSFVRHVIFSYRLTKSYGPVFAEQMTNAREKGDKDDSRAERLADHKSAKLAREYALKGMIEDEMLMTMIAELIPDSDPEPDNPVSSATDPLPANPVGAVS